MKDMARRLCLLALIVAIALPAAAAIKNFHIYRPQHRLAEDLLTPVTAIAGPNLLVNLDARTGSLIFIGPQSDIDALLKRMPELDRPLLNVEIVTKRVTREELKRYGIDVHWRVRSGWRVGRPPQTEVQTGVTWTDRLERVQGERRERLVLQDGVAGKVVTGEERAVLEGESVARIVAQTGVYIEPRLLGGGKKIHLKLSALTVKWEGDALKETLGATTELDLEPGRSVLVADVQQQAVATSEGVELKTSTDAYLWIKARVVTY